MKKFFFLILFFSLFILNLAADANEIDKYIKESGILSRSTAAVLVTGADNNSVLYKKNEKKLLNPASVLKVLTFGVSYLTLGADYNFETSIYKDTQNNLYIKLSGDTLLTQDDLNNLFYKLKSKFDVTKINNIYIDDTIIDKTPYPSGWMEDDIWPFSRAITPYIVDKNYVKVAINRSSLATKVDIIQNDPYKFAFINELVLGDKQNIKISRKYGENSPIITLYGTVTKDEIRQIPVLLPEVNFNIKLRKAIDKNEIKYFNKINPKKLPSNSTKLVSVSHSLDKISKEILHYSDNFSAEVVFRVAAAKFINYSHPATLEDAIEMFKNKFPLEEGVTLADASGVSRYNLLSCEFINKILFELFKSEDFKKLLATSNQGTLCDRLLFLNNNLRAKTGTLSSMSSIAGTLKTRKQNDIIFSIIVQNSPKRKAVLKNFEDSIITIIYRKY